MSRCIFLLFTATFEILKELAVSKPLAKTTGLFGIFPLSGLFSTVQEDVRLRFATSSSVLKTPTRTAIHACHAADATT